MLKGTLKIKANTKIQHKHSRDINESPENASERYRLYPDVECGVNREANTLN